MKAFNEVKSSRFAYDHEVGRVLPWLTIKPHGPNNKARSLSITQRRSSMIIRDVGFRVGHVIVVHLPI